MVKNTAKQVMLGCVFALVTVGAVHSSEPESAPVPLPGAREIQALRETFPHRVTDIGFRKGEWALQIDGEWFYWAQGRLLPEHSRERWDEFVSIRFYNYQLGPWQEREIDPDLEARLRERTANRNNDDRIRFNRFLDRLYRIENRGEADQRMRRVEFLGMSTRVHTDMVAALDRVETRIRNIMMTDQEVRAYVRNLSGLHGFNWRNIAGTARRSYHAYGMAIDLVPRVWNGRWGYWRWAADGGVSDWWNLQAEQRYHPPQPVIDAFEGEGFIWGGKWLFFDPIHFEYRPEVIMMARSPNRF
ncbi:MAG: M15 family metallopeptidase [Alkalispirochaeta sp.]